MCRAKSVLVHKWIAGRWQQSGHFGQIELQVAKRTSTDATLMDTRSERGGEKLRVNKRQREGQSDWISEHIAHYSPHHILTVGTGGCGAHSLWCGGWCVYVCVSICLRTLAHIAALTLVSGGNRKRTVRWCEKSAVNNLWHLAAIFGLMPYDALQQLHDRPLQRRA